MTPSRIDHFYDYVKSVCLRYDSYMDEDKHFIVARFSTIDMFHS